MHKAGVKAARDALNNHYGSEYADQEDPGYQGRVKVSTGTQGKDIVTKYIRQHSKSYINHSELQSVTSVNLSC